MKDTIVLDSIENEFHGVLFFSDSTTSSRVARDLLSSGYNIEIAKIQSHTEPLVEYIRLTYDFPTTNGTLVESIKSCS